MKARNHAGERKKDRRSSYRAAGSSRAETAVFAILGFAGLVAIVVAVMAGSVPAGSKEEALAPLGGLPVVRYFRSGQWAADARTAAAIVRYVFESEESMATNAIQPGPTQKNLAMPTNNASHAPKA